MMAMPHKLPGLACETSSTSILRVMDTYRHHVPLVVMGLYDHTSGQATVLGAEFFTLGGTLD